MVNPVILMDIFSKYGILPDQELEIVLPGIRN
jgi:hypothetical protein